MKSESTGPKSGDTVKFAVGRMKTTFEAKVTDAEGAFLVTTDAAGKVRKVRAGACTVMIPTDALS